MLGGFTVIIMQVSVQIGLNLTGLKLSLAKLAMVKNFNSEGLVHGVQISKSKILRLIDFQTLDPNIVLFLKLKVLKLIFVFSPSLYALK